MFGLNCPLHHWVTDPANRLGYLRSMFGTEAVPPPLHSVVTQWDTDPCTRVRLRVRVRVRLGLGLGLGLGSGLCGIPTLVRELDSV